MVEGEERGPAQHEGDRAQTGAGGAGLQLPAERVGEDAAQREVDEAEQAHREAGRQQRVERVRGVEHASLEGGEEGQPRNLVGIPERKLAARQGGSRVGVARQELREEIEVGEADQGVAREQIQSEYHRRRHGQEREGDGGGTPARSHLVLCTFTTWYSFLSESRS